MNLPPIESEELDAVLVCGECGRVNHVMHGANRSTAVRCSGCGNLLRGERPRKINIDCPDCQNRLEIEAGWIGQEIVCGSCSNRFVAQREGEFALPGRTSTGVPPDALQRVGVPDDEFTATSTTETEVVDAQGRRMRVRRTRKKKRVREKSWKKLILTTLSSLLTFGIVIGVIVVVGRRSGWWLAGEAPVVPPPPATEEPAPANPAEPVMATAEAAALEKCFRTFCLAPEPIEMLSYVRFPSEVGTRFRKYYTTHNYVPMGMRRMQVSARVVAGERLLLRYTEIANTKNPAHLVVERVAPGEFLIDWDSHVRYASMDWEAFTTTRPTDPQRFQCFLKRDFIGNTNYPVEEYNAFLVFWDEESDGVAMFVKRDSEQDRMLVAATEPQKKISPVEPSSPRPGEFPMTLEVFFPTSVNVPNQPAALELKGIIHEGWVNTASGRE